MPSQLLDHLRRFFDQGVVPAGANPTHPLDQVMAQQNANRSTETLGNPPTQDPTKPNRPGVNIAKHWASTSWGSKMAKNTVPAVAPLDRPDRKRWTLAIAASGIVFAGAAESRPFREDDRPGVNGKQDQNGEHYIGRHRSFTYEVKKICLQ